MKDSKSALVIVFSEARNDPRVRHQITWLAEDGWSVDTIGWGGLPSEEVNKHFDLLPQRAWVGTKWGSAFVYALFPLRYLFRVLTSDRIPLEARRHLRNGKYDLVVFDDFDFLPIIRDPAIFSKATIKAHVHLDIHEYRGRSKPLTTAWRYLTRRFYVWQRAMIGDLRIDSRSTVASRIADLYSRDFAIDTPAIVRNCPPYESQNPSALESGRVRLVYHGLASASRGLAEMIEAMERLDERFTLTFMLTGNEAFQKKLRTLAAPLGARVNFVPPVPMPAIAAEINKYDLEIMFFKPVTKNLEFALPNKLFEAVQGRLGLVIGRSPMMVEVVEEFDNGIVVDGWSVDSLVSSLNSLTQEEVVRLKQKSHEAALQLSAESEGKAFLKPILGSQSN
tara:strand:- start:1560 stop:2738 length:1179 start_codon:yes stop_codon:yes gene_type:complete